ncbi:MAG TPA: ArsI/CadI family heavy metal resistance metalloenzyme [Candidatus Binataceae bacterium]|nr:ArsI/CadI family heavy metal resistance metalloenzyme [Candidatus Binataceae bacterium]
MKRFHVHVRVADLEQSIGFYSTLFGVQPTVLKTDYAKWMLEDPRVNFAISTHASNAGLDHLGLQVESDEDLANIAGRLTAAGNAVATQKNASCCYAVGNKEWVADPSGISWETFHTFGENTVYGTDSVPREALTLKSSGGCCPTELPGSTCCGTSSTRN